MGFRENSEFHTARFYFMAFFDNFFSLVKDLNKVKSVNQDETQEGVTQPLLPELELSMSDEELLALKKKWEQKWAEYYPDVLKKQEENQKYWLGQHFENVQATAGLQVGRPFADNLIFESLETFLPIATRHNPEPTVSSDNTPEGNALAQRVQKMLVYLADTLRLKLRMKRVARYWAIYLLGVAKVGWSMVENNIDLKVLRPQKFILDPDGTVDEDMQYTGEYVGEYRKDSASDLISRFPKKKDFITSQVQSNLGSQVQYMEWWTDDYVFWTLKNEVLGKVKNPHWNYEQTQTTVDEFGQQTTQIIKGNNHFNARKKPYIFLSIFNLGLHPYDETSLIGQNLTLQDLINKRQKQIDKNTDGMNGGWAISGERSGLTKEQASQAIEAVRKGGGIYIPSGDPNTAVVRMTGGGLPADVFNQLSDARNELRNIFGTRGSSPQGTIKEPTVRGKIIIKGQDADRIGGGFSEYLEQFADQIFNWFVQLMYVYYDEEHSASILGRERAMEYITLKNIDLTRKLTVSVKEGSLVPKDNVTQANQAVDLAIAGLLDPITLFDRLEFSNPRESAKQLFLWKASPASLFPDLGQPGMVPPQAGLPAQGGSPAQQPPALPVQRSDVSRVPINPMQ